jgi:hypothetical protein
VDRFETPYQPAQRSDDPKRFFFIRFLVVVVVFAAILIVWLITHPLAPGSVTVSISAHTQFAAGALEKIDVTMISKHGYPAWDSVDWGDGITEPNPNRHPTGFHSDPCANYTTGVPIGGTPSPIPHVNVGTLPPEQGHMEFSHRYRRPGTYHVTVHADEFGWVCTNQRSPSGHGSILLHVTGPVPPGNGPVDPRPGFVLKTYDSYSRLAGYFGADDPDGYLRSITVTWVDGATGVYTNFRGCENHDNVWPSNVLIIQWKQHIKPGDYTVKVTALSTDCSGGESQTITLIARFRLRSRGFRIQMTEITFIPHKPTGNRGSYLPASDFFSGSQIASVP